MKRYMSSNHDLVYMIHETTFSQSIAPVFHGFISLSEHCVSKINSLVFCEALEYKVLITLSFDILIDRRTF